MVPALKRAAAEVALRVWDKVNVAKTARDLRDLGRKHGTRFLVAAALWTLLEDLVLPGTLALLGFTKAALLVTTLHLEPLVFPAMLAGFRAWDAWTKRPVG